MDIGTELLEPLLVGLSVKDQQTLLRRIDAARHEQLDRKLHPRRRRRRNELGLLVHREDDS